MIGVSESVDNLGGPLNPKGNAELALDLEVVSIDDYPGDLGIEFVKSIELKDIIVQFVASGTYNGYEDDEFEINGKETNFEIDLDDFPLNKGSQRITVPNEEFTVEHLQMMDTLQIF